MKFLIADSDAIFREGLQSLLARHPEFDYLGQASTADEVVEQLHNLKPDLVLLEFGLPGSVGFSTLAQIWAEQPGTVVVMMAAEDSDDILFEAIRSGAQGLIVKGTPFDKIFAALLAVKQGEAAISRSMATRLAAEFRRIGAEPSMPPKALNKLTSRELEVLTKLGEGASNRQIAQDLVVSEHTIKAHVRNVLAKLKLKNRAQAANLARQYALHRSKENGAANVDGTNGGLHR